MNQKRFKIEARPAKCWWVSVFDKNKNDYIQRGFIAHSEKEAKERGQKLIDEYIIDCQIEEMKEQINTDDSETLENKKRELEEKLKGDLPSFQRETTEAMLEEIKRELSQK